MSALQNQPSNYSFLSPIGFKFQLNNFPEVNYFCQAATLPGISIGTIPVPTPLKQIELSGDEVTFEELSIRFVIDENMKNWLAIYDWIIGLGFPTEEGQAKYKKLKEDGALTTTATLTVLTGNMNPQINFNFQEVFPLNLSSISFDSSGTEVEYVTADVSFRYDVYTVENLLNNESSYEGKPV
tara:strand:+ start:80 stop:628 length:549 start_codon:yes stop_codon:yes gene_type:complete